MSKVAIQGDVSGTGTLTIAAPNTNSDRTLSLPDAAGEMYAQGNIVGTVSQSGGVPTGAIIERGSNANGEFVKYADGTLICTRTGSITVTANTKLDVAWTYPSTFAQTPRVFNTIDNASSSEAYDITRSNPRITSGSGTTLSFKTTVSQGHNYFALAVGLWF
jgi:hypothetical protein